ncbi:hypothetical protein FSP39_007724 [Pinctada imbricata]|uniref:Uncharacterized protein n=1 Tax=Pinctada imbricata TaxID=66713 RepID=A0AA89BT82_PINIB|nr:hypothetical protein FSP39_007724 [Pinctada imbricata]
MKLVRKSPKTPPETTDLNKFSKIFSGIDYKVGKDAWLPCPSSVHKERDSDMDTVDSPFLKKKQKKADPMMSELERKLRQRRSDGLTYGLTDDDDITEEVPEDDGDESEDDYLAQYRMDPAKQKRTNRPGSAKRRSPSYQEMNEIALGDTLHPGAGNRFMKGYGKDNKGSVGGGGEGMPALSPKGRSSSPGMPSLTSPKLSPKSPGGGIDPYRKDSKGRTSPLVPQQPLSKEDIIFGAGRKTPTYDTRRSPVENKPWQPPNFRKSPGLEQQDQKATSPVLGSQRAPSPGPGSQRAPSPGPGSQRALSPGPGLQGRRTPSQEPMLQPISERNTPRSGRQISPKGDRKSPSSRQLSIESPRSEVPKPKPRNKTDIFGKTTQEDFDLETDSPGGHRFMRAGRQQQMQNQQQAFQGRKTPTNTELSGRKTPTGRKSPGLINEKNSSDKRDFMKKEKQPEIKREPSLLDFLTGDTEEPKKNKDFRLKKEEAKPKLLKRDISGDSMTEEKNIRDDILSEHKSPSVKAREKHRQQEKEAVKEWRKERDADKQIPDDSSMCEEFDKDPYGRSFKTKESTKPEKKVSESKRAGDAIDQVAMEQEKPGTIKPIDPNKSLKKGEKLHKPKPRHSLPGTPSSTEKKEKQLENESSYREWLKQKKETHDPEVKSKKLKEEEKKKKEEDEKEQKKKEAEKNFALWKEEKEAVTREKKHRELMKKRQQERAEEEKKKEKEKENMTAMRGW